MNGVVSVSNLLWLFSWNPSSLLILKNRQRIKLLPSYIVSDHQCSAKKFRELYPSPFYKGVYYGDCHRFSTGSCMVLGFFEMPEGVHAKISLIYSSENGVWVRSNSDHGFETVFTPPERLGEKVIETMSDVYNREKKILYTLSINPFCCAVQCLF